MNDVTAIPILRHLFAEREKLIYTARRKRSLSETERRELADNHRAECQALDRAIGALQSRMRLAKESET